MFITFQKYRVRRCQEDDGRGRVFHTTKSILLPCLEVLLRRSSLSTGTPSRSSVLPRFVPVAYPERLELAPALQLFHPLYALLLRPSGG